MAGLESLSILYGVGAVLSPNRGRTVGVLGKWEIKTSCADRAKDSPLLMTSLKASRSSGYFATGLQKFQAWPAQSSTVNAM